MPIDYRALVSLWRRGRFCIRVAGALAAPALAGLGCLPTPEIHVPDFSPVAPADAGSAGDSASPDGAGGDLGMLAGWAVDAQVGAKDTLRAVWTDAAQSQAYVVGHNGLLLHRSGGTWQKEQAQIAGKPLTTNLYAIAAASTDVVYAVGAAGVILRRTGGTWMQEGQELATTSDLFGVAVLATGEVIVVGEGGFIARRQASGVYAAEVTTALGGASLRAVAGTTLDGLYAVGLGAVIAQRVADKWQLDPLPIDTADRGNYYAVTQGADGVFVAGEYARVLRRDVAKWTREAVIAPTPPNVTHFFGLYAAPGALWTVGTSGVIQRRDSATKMWSADPSNVSAALYGITGAGPTGAVAVGDQGTVLRRM